MEVGGEKGKGQQEERLAEGDRNRANFTAPMTNGSMVTTTGMIGEGLTADMQGDGRDNLGGTDTVDCVSLQALVVVEAINQLKVL
jgi:hypothetical protein